MRRTPTVQRLNRRQFVLAGFTAASFAQLATSRPINAESASACWLSPQQEEGPFYISGEHIRYDIRDGHAGTPMILQLRVLAAAQCAPIAAASVDIWHCSADGVYSGYTAEPMGRPPGGPPGPPGGGPDGARPPGPGPFAGGPAGDPFRGGPPHAKPTTAATFLRGVQVTDRDGRVHFSTIFPGFYEGRVNHVHLKVHLPASSSRAMQRSTVVHTGQVFFPEDVARAISSEHPYVEHRIERTTLQADPVFSQQSGRSSIATLQRAERHGVEAYVATLTLFVDTMARPNAHPMQQ